MTFSLKPIHEKSPFEKRLYSFNDKIARTAFRLNKRNSEIPSVKRVSISRFANL